MAQKIAVSETGSSNENVSSDARASGNEESGNDSRRLREDLSDDGLIIDALKRHLQDLQCPFTWNIPEEFADDALKRKETKVAEGKLAKDEMDIALTLCYEYEKRGHREKAFKVLEEWIIDDHKEGIDGVGDLKEPKEHVHMACQCFLLFKANRFRETRETLKKITPFKCMSIDNQAAILCMRSEMIKNYGITGLKQGIIIIEKALTSSPASVILNLQLANLLGKLRRMEDWNGLPDPREIPCLENVLLVTRSPDHMVRVAQLYREMATSIFFAEKQWKKEPSPLIDRLNRKASDLFREVLEVPERDAFINMNCAQGFMTMPPPWRDLHNAEKCLLEALEVYSNEPKFNHIAGIFYKMKGDLERAKHYLSLSTAEMTRNIGGCIELMIIKQRENRRYCPIDDLERLLVQFGHEEAIVKSILCKLGGYCYFIKRDFQKAFEYWEQVIEQDINCNILKFARSQLIHIKEPHFSINKIIISEIHSLINEGRCNERQKCVYDKLLDAFPNLLEESLEESQSQGGAAKSSNQTKFEKYKSHSGYRTRRENEDISWRTGTVSVSPENRMQYGSRVQGGRTTVSENWRSGTRDNGTECNRKRFVEGNGNISSRTTNASYSTSNSINWSAKERGYTGWRTENSHCNIRLETSGQSQASKWRQEREYPKISDSENWRIDAKQPIQEKEPDVKIERNHSWRKTQENLPDTNSKETK